VPEQIRAALHARKVRVIDLFRQLDDDLSGQISAVEFLKAMREFGLQAPADAIAAVFQSFDPDGSNSIEYAELHQLLIRSVQKHPRLAPLKTKAENKVEIRKSPVKKKNSNLLGDLHLAGERKGGVVDDTMPDRIREALHKGYVRVIDLFRQFDDDGDGKVSVFEFLKAMRELGLEAPPQEILPVFNSIDRDGSGFMELRELEKLLRNSIKQQPHLKPLPVHPLPKPKMGSARSSPPSKKASPKSPKAASSKSSNSKSPPKKA